MDRIEELTNVFVNSRNVLVRETSAFHLFYIANVKVGRWVQPDTSFITLWVSLSHRGIRRRGKKFKSLLELGVKPTKRPKARENVRDQIVIRCSFSSDWLRERRFLDQSQSEAMQNQSNFGSLLSLNIKCLNYYLNISDLPGRYQNKLFSERFWPVHVPF